MSTPREKKYFHNKIKLAKLFLRSLAKKVTLLKRVWRLTAEKIFSEGSLHLISPVSPYPRRKATILEEPPDAEVFGLEYINRDALKRWRLAVEGLLYFAYNEQKGVSKLIQVSFVIILKKSILFDIIFIK